MNSMQMWSYLEDMKAKKIIEQYLRLPLQFKATIWFAVCQFLQKGINLLTDPFVARMLSTEEYGRASTFNACIYMGSITIFFY